MSSHLETITVQALTCAKIILFIVLIGASFVAKIGRWWSVVTEISLQEDSLIQATLEDERYQRFWQRAHGPIFNASSSSRMQMSSTRWSQLSLFDLPKFGSKTPITDRWPKVPWVKAWGFSFTAIRSAWQVFSLSMIFENVKFQIYSRPFDSRFMTAKISAWLHHTVQAIVENKKERAALGNTSVSSFQLWFSTYAISNNVYLLRVHCSFCNWHK